MYQDHYPFEFEEKKAMLYDVWAHFGGPGWEVVDSGLTYDAAVAARDKYRRIEDGVEFRVVKAREVTA